MIFALIDYIKYKQQKGIYSLGSIHEHDAVLAVPSLLPELEKCQPGDYVSVHTADSILSWAVMYYTGPTIWSHSMLFGEDGYIYDCTTQGMLKRHISDYFDGKTYISIIKLSEKMSENDKKKVVIYGEQMLGTQFAWKKIIFFWLAIVLGYSRSAFRICCVADIFILIVGFMFIFYKVLFLRYVFLILGVVYLLVAVFSRIWVKFVMKNDIKDLLGE